MGKDSFYIFRSNNFVDLNLYQCGWEHCASGHSFGPTTRNHYLFHYVVNGKGTLWANGPKGDSNIFNIGAGEGFMIFPGQITTYFADKDNPWEYTWIEFDGLKVNESLKLTSFTQETPIYKTCDKEKAKLLMNEMHYISHNGDESAFNIMGHLYMWLSYLIESSRRAGKIHSERLSDFYIKEAINFIEQRFNTNISVEEIAENCGINRSYLSKIFKNSMGKSPMEFLMTYRMSKACELLKVTDLSIADIGKAVGYDNPLHFSRAFKNSTGYSPRQWRERK